MTGSAIKHALQHCAIQLSFGLAFALIVSGVIAAAEQTSFTHALEVGLFGVGALAFGLGALGIAGGSPAQTLVNTYGRFLTVDEFETQPPGGTVVNATAILLLTGALLLGAGVAVDAARGSRPGASAGPVRYESCFEI